MSFLDPTLSITTATDEPHSSVVQHIEPLSQRRVLIVSTRLFREALKHLLGECGMELYDGPATIAEAVAEPLILPPPNLVIGVAFGDEMRRIAFAAVREACVQWPNMRWLVLTDAVTPRSLREAALSGIDGLLLHDISGRVLRHAAELILLGQTLLPAMLVAAVDGAGTATLAASPEPEAPSRRAAAAVAVEAAPPMPRAVAPQPRLSERERQILDCLIKGYSNKLIARNLQIADATVKVHVKGLLRKLQVANRTQAAILALDMAAMGDPP